MEEENRNGNPEQTEAPASGLGKFKSVEALVRAYGELEAEFTRRSQRLKAVEEQLEQEKAHAAPGQEELLRAAAQNDEVRARIVSDYLQSLRGAPLMGAGGTGVVAPRCKPSTIGEAGDLALGYLRNQNK